MTREEAAKILNVRSNATLQQTEKAYESLRRKYVDQSQHATDPRERKMANDALGLLQDAYQVMTGTTAPSQIKPQDPTVATGYKPIVRVALGGGPVQDPSAGYGGSQTAASKPASHPPRGQGNRSRVRAWLPETEQVVASFICAAMFLIALLILGCI